MFLVFFGRQSLHLSAAKTEKTALMHMYILMISREPDVFLVTNQYITYMFSMENTLNRLHGCIY